MKRGCFYLPAECFTIDLMFREKTKLPYFGFLCSDLFLIFAIRGCSDKNKDHVFLPYKYFHYYRQSSRFQNHLLCLKLKHRAECLQDKCRILTLKTNYIKLKFKKHFLSDIQMIQLKCLNLLFFILNNHNKSSEGVIN